MMQNKRKSFAQVQRIGKYTYGNVHCVVLCQDYFEHPTSVGLFISNLFVEIDCVLETFTGFLLELCDQRSRVFVVCDSTKKIIFF